MSVNSCICLFSSRPSVTSAVCGLCCALQIECAGVFGMTMSWYLRTVYNSFGPTLLAQASLAALGLLVAIAWNIADARGPRNLNWL